MGPPASGVPWQIVGVVADAEIGGLGSAPMPTIYAPVWQQARNGGVLAVRMESAAAGHTERWSAPLRAAVHAADPDVAITEVRTMREMAALSLAEPRTRAWMAAAFAAVALVLAALGIYGVVSYSVSQSTQEMGIRMALGARPGQVLLRTLREGLGMTAFGLILGVAGSLALTRLLGNLLFAVRPTDPATYAAVSAILLAVAMLAAYMPARRAARVDPATALRWE